ncbi:hypothetical protein [Hyphomicrobium sp.]|uniref:hypothetical protein n=1 Tax=Hyphomicrobium sp. TaxID=82 RepID=UPI003F6F35A0
MSLKPSKFIASHLKVKRAESHLEELRRGVEAYLALNPVVLVWESCLWSERFAGLYSSDFAIAALVSRVRIPVPEEMAPIVGDIVHNLRSALDIMMCEIVRDADPSVDVTRTCFPFWEGGKGRRSREYALEKSQAHRAGENVLSLIEASQPFKGGASRLYALSQLDNMDKHRALIPTMNGAKYSEGHASCIHRIPAHELIDPFPVLKAAYDGKLFQVCPLETSPPLGTEVPCACLLGLDGVEDIEGRGLLEEMKWQIDVVHGTLLSFEFGMPFEFMPDAPRKPAFVGNGIWIGPPEMSFEDLLK